MGIVAAIFLAVMSVFYLQQIPTQEDLDRLEEDLRREHGLYLSATAPIKISLELPDKERTHTGLEIVCLLRPDISKQPRVARSYLGRIASSVLEHPDWRGKLAYVRVHEPAPTELTVTRRPALQSGS